MINVAVLGYGIVGSGVVEIIKKNGIIPKLNFGLQNGIFVVLN